MSRVAKSIAAQPWGEGPNDLDLDRYCNLLALDLEEIMTFPRSQQRLLPVGYIKPILMDFVDNDESSILRDEEVMI